MTAGLQLGSPGVYFTPVRQVAELPEVHLDETGFVGIARRGPVNRAVKVTSWSDYVWWFGDVPTPDRGEPPTMLALAVQAYFAQGGRTAWVLRVAPAEPGEATAGFAAPGRPALRFDAANEGSWGNSLSIVLEFVASAEFVTRAVTEGQDWGFVCPDGVELPTHSLVRTRPVAIFGGATTVWVTGTRVGSSRSDGTTCLVDRRLPVDAGELVSIAVITGRLRIGDGDPRGERSELFDQLGLRPGHVRFIPDVVGTGIDSLMDRNMRCRAKTVDRSSNLVTVPEPWTESIPPDDQLRPLRFQRIRDGYDRWRQIDRRAFFDDASADADPLDEECHRGIDAIGRIEEIGLLCVPDLFWQRRQTEEPPPVDEITYGSGDFEPCNLQVLPPPIVAATTTAMWLDPRIPSDLDEIVQRQRLVVGVAQLRHRFVALLDVPQGLTTREIARWRANFDSDFAACYHPWLGVPDAGLLSISRFVPPSAFAAGIIAGREIRLGIHRGPANELAARAVSASSAITDAAAAALFGQAVNVFRPERDGFRLQSARTLSTDPQYRQLSVRRLMTSIMLSLQRIGDRLVFEPNNQDLRAALVQTISGVLGDFHRRGAFAGATEADSFFVRCDDSLNTSQTAAQGQLIAEVGVAPAAPLEFIVVRIVQSVDGETVVSERG